VRAADWQDISTAPMDGRRVLICYESRNGHYFHAVAWWGVDEDDEASWMNNEELFDRVVQWLPLPPLPDHPERIVPLGWEEQA